MPHTIQFEKLEHNFEKEYGKKKGESYVYGYAHKHNINIDRR